MHGLVGVQEAREAGGSEDEGRPRRVVLTQQDRYRHVALTTPVFVLVELLQTTLSLEFRYIYNKMLKVYDWVTFKRETTQMSDPLD